MNSAPADPRDNTIASGEERLVTHPRAAADGVTPSISIPAARATASTWSTSRRGVAISSTCPRFGGAGLAGIVIDQVGQGGGEFPLSLQAQRVGDDRRFRRRDLLGLDHDPLGRYARHGMANGNVGFLEELAQRLSSASPSVSASPSGKGNSTR